MERGERGENKEDEGEVSRRKVEEESNTIQLVYSLPPSFNLPPFLPSFLLSSPTHLLLGQRQC